MYVFNKNNEIEIKNNIRILSEKNNYHKTRRAILILGYWLYKPDHSMFTEIYKHLEKFETETKDLRLKKLADDELYNCGEFTIEHYDVIGSGITK